MFRQGIPDIELFIEQDTLNTPEPKAFYLFHKAEIVGIYQTLKPAIKRYREIIIELGYTPKAQEPVDMKTTIAKAAQDDLIVRNEVFWSGSDRRSSRGHRS